ncbi:M15 family metallopeptidase [Winogradskyella bathintestinalis]|uniref:M15 family metallopeptidase n=1 Tax=Winogradskyella bathintestinalis TaxID=3035208 RepID=A0ABT7ZVJ8_9FLAO|nr:M15 family metallopeptidase [Winogradskyella bathintestinalis]MDN3493003.1 M15 family metallopeptidase [Winogradskyella bathintestinalis]
MKQFILLFMLSVFVFSCNEQVKPVKHIFKMHGHLGNFDINNTEDYNKAKAFVLGKFDYKVHSKFIKVESKYSEKTLYLDNDVYTAFLKMHEAAKKDGISLSIISGTRNFEEQKVIWERKWNSYNNLDPNLRAQKILEYSSMPLTSRHHWGTDMDLNSLNNSYFSKGRGKLEYDWLTSNASTFGFYQTYTSKDNGRTGYNLEKWHWSYLPLASQYLKFYNHNINYEDINGFKGDTLAVPNKMISNYVNGLSEKALEYN